MTKQEIDKLKRISIRGRFAYGLMCLERVTENNGVNFPELQLLITKMWEITNSEKLGWWQDLLIENNPNTVIGDYQLFKNGKITFKEIGFSTINNLEEFESRVNFLKKLPSPIVKLIDKLTEIVNQNLFAGCGEHSESTLKPTIELVEILDSILDFERPIIEIVKFSKFSENHGWGNKFTRGELMEQAKLEVSRRKVIVLEREEGKREVAVNMIKAKFDDEIISKLTDLGIAEINRLRKEVEKEN